MDDELWVTDLWHPEAPQRAVRVHNGHQGITHRGPAAVRLNTGKTIVL